MENKVKFRLPDFHLPFTSSSDPVLIYNCDNKILRAIYERRIAICFDLLKKGYDRVLDLGAGCGVCIPTLLDISNYVLGLDYHKELYDVKETLASKGYKRFDLVKADAYKLPFRDQSFDLIIGISIFEHLASNDNIVDECKRVLADDGHIVLGIPVENFITELRRFYFSYKYNEMYSYDHEIYSTDILKGLERHFRIDETRKLIPFAPSWASLYFAIRLKKR